VAGPVGAAIGAVVGAVGGGLAGKGIAESIDPTAEDAYWRENYHSRPYADKSRAYDEYRPAYQYGWESRSLHADKPWEQVESELQTGWAKARGTSRLEWDQASHAARDAWDRIGSARGSTTAR